MRLITTLWPTIKWKPLFIWNIVLIILAGVTNDVTILMIVVGIVGVILLNTMLVLMVWNKVLYGQIEGYPIISIWNHIVADIQITDINAGISWKMKQWCMNNCKGKWLHDRRG